MPAAPIPKDDPARLETLYSYSILDTLAEQEFDDITTLASFVAQTPVSLISLVDESRQWFKARVGLDAHETTRAESFCAYTLTNPGPLIVEDALSDLRFADNPLVTGDPNIRFYAGAPLVAPNGHILGTLCVIDTQPRSFTSRQIEALNALARQVMTLFEARLLARNNQRTTEALIQSEKLAAVGRLASSIAHEINNPLEAVTNLLYLARQNTVVPQVQEWLAQADLELRRVSAITGHTLRFHRQSSLPEAVSCVSLFSATLNLYQAKLNNYGIAVEKRKRANEQIRCFEGDVRQVLSNLFTNAIDAMPTGGRLLIRSREGTEWRTGKRGIVLTVADNGTGISDEDKPHLFEAFFTTKGIGGAGLGLWVSKQIVERHQGKILIRSSQRTHRSGTVVALFLPFDTA